MAPDSTRTTLAKDGLIKLNLLGILCGSRQDLLGICAAEATPFGWGGYVLLLP